MVAGPVLYPAERAPEVLRRYRDVAATASAALGTIVNLRLAPPAPWVPPDLHGRPVVAVMACYAGPVEEGQAAARPLETLGPPLLDLLEPRPYLLHQRMLDAAVPPGLRYYWKSRDLLGLTDAAVDTLVDHAWHDTSPRSYTLLF